jgi:hypothetical protein
MWEICLSRIDMNIVDAEENLKKITAKFSKDTFIFDLMTAYDFPKSTISKLKIKNKNHDDFVVPSKLHFVAVSKKDFDSKFDELVKEYSSSKKVPRFIIVTDYQNLKAYDTKVAEKLDTEIKNLSKHPDFFLPWAGIEKKVFQGENPADVKAAEKLAKFFDLILKDNLKLVEKNRHALNVFLTRILFCFFAEDTDIFKKGLFTESIASHTKSDGGDLDDYLQRLFEVLNKKSRVGLPDFLKEFPYVNGGLFAEEFPIPKFSKKSRESLIDLGSDLNWAEINPDIFGSMIQAVVHPDQRAGLGMHYTSVTNIMKVIDPLFLTELKEEYVSAKDNKNKLNKLLERIGNVKIFDPACGSGNFLIIAYKELRLLEMQILKTLGEIPMSRITLSNFYGIEIDDFAHEVAKLSLWLAEHQMDVLFNKQFGDVKVSLPLKDSGKIICENATKLDWETVCPNKGEIFILGNPPYLGAKVQSDSQKEEVKSVFLGNKNGNTFDYILCWFAKASAFIKKNNSSKFSFVSTNSICQGEQVAFWETVEANNQEIFFAYPSFKWTNNAKSKAKVIVIILGVRNKSLEPKIIFGEGSYRQAKNINYYLLDAGNLIVKRCPKPINGLPLMYFGSIAYDGGYLFLTDNEKKEIIANYPEAKRYIRRAIGTNEYLNEIVRWCLWIDEVDYDKAKLIPPIKERLLKVVQFRKGSKTKSTRDIADRPYRFKQDTYKQTKQSLLIVPRVSSEKRIHLPIGMFPPETITVDAQVLYNAPVYLFAVLSSRLHLEWVSITSGRLKLDYRYSSAMSYNTFPLPVLTESAKKELETIGLQIISIRAKYNGIALGDLYDPKKMPPDLATKHAELDKFIESLFGIAPSSNKEERLAMLFKLFEKMKG